MPGLMARILSRRANGAPPTAPLPPDATAPDEAIVAVPAPTDDQPTEVQPAIAPESVEAQAPDEAPGEPAADASGAEPATDAGAESLPAGAEAEPVPGPSFLNRGRLRRRLRYLRRVREIGFRDLGGLVFDLDRFGRERPDLVQVKLEGLRSIDAELRALEGALQDERPVEELSEPGIASCPHCGALHGSDARFCPACGIAAGTPLPEPVVEAPATAEAATEPAEPAPEQPTA